MNIFKRSTKKKQNSEESSHSVMLLPEPGTKDRLDDIEIKIAAIQSKDNVLIERLIVVVFFAGFVCGVFFS